MSTIALSSQQEATHHRDSTLTRLNYGAVFKLVDSLDVVTDTWSQTFIVQLPRADVSEIRTANVDCAHFGHTEGCDNVIHLVQFLQNASTKAVVRINETLVSIHRLIRHFDFSGDDRTRVDRGLFDFVGEISHSLFGTARDGDIAKIQQTLQHYKQNQHALASAWQQSGNRLASLSKSVNHRLDNMRDMINLQKRTVHELFTQVRDETAGLSRASSIIATALSRFEDFVLLVDHLDSFRYGVELLSNGILSPDIVHSGDLNRALQAITRRLRRFSSGNLRILRNKVTHYYRMHDFVALRHDDDLILHVPVPLGPLPVPLYLYEIHLLPVPTPDTSTHATILTGMPKYIAHHPFSPYYLEFDDKPVVTMSKLLFLDQSNSVLKPVTAPSCILSILRDNSTDIRQSCQFTVVTNSVKPQVFVLDSRHVLLTNMSHVVLDCPDKARRNVTCQASCRVTVPCRCSLISDSVFLPGRIEKCQPWTTATILHTVNLAFLRHFFEESELSELFGNTLLPDPMQVFVPRLKILEANFSHELEIDKQARFDLAHLANLTKKDQKAFPSLAHSMVDSWQDYASGSFDWNFSLVSWRSWGLVFIGLLAGISFGFSVLLSYRLRILAATVTSLSLPGRAYAIPTALNYFSSTTPSINYTNIFIFGSEHVDWTLDALVIVLLLILVLMTVVKLCRCYQKRRYEFQLYLHVGLGNSSCQIWIKTFKLQPDHYQFSATDYVDSLHVVGCIMPRLMIIWPTLRITSHVTNDVYQLPKTVALTWAQAIFLRKILRKSYWCVFITKSLDGQSLLSLPNRDWQAAPSYGHVNEAMSLVNVSAPALYPSLAEAETKF